MTRWTKAERSEAIDDLRKILTPGATVHTVLRHVSRSGMQRRIDCYVVEDGDVRWISRLVAQAIGAGMKGDAIVVGGCGMDMGFHIVNSLWYALYGEGFGCTGEKCPSNDHSNGDRDHTPHTCEEGAFPPQHGRDYANPHKATADGGACHWHKSGGYALRHRWI